MDNEAEITQHFNDPLSNRIWSECNITQSNASPLGDINIKEEPIEYENADQKIPPEEITFVQNIDSKPCLEIGDSKITYNLDTQNVDYDSQPSNHHQFKFEKIQMDITSSETEAYDKGVVKKEEESYCSKCGFKFDSDDVPSNTICIECNVAEKDVFPLGEKDTKSECLEIEDSKISYNLDSQNVHHQFESEDGQKDCMPSEPEVHDREGMSEEKIHYCSKCAFKFDLKVSYPQHIVNTDKKSFMCNLCGYKSKYKAIIERHTKNIHTIDDKCITKPVEGYMHELKMHKCSRCTCKTNCKSELTEYLTTHGLNKNTDSRGFVRIAQTLYKCKLCEYESRHQSAMYSHVFKKHDSIKINKHKCSQCDYRTHSSNRLKRHLLMHHGMRSYECEVCNKRFPNEYTLRNHIWTHSSEKRFQCLHCAYKGNYKSALAAHVKRKHVNQEYKDYKCMQCPYETNIKSDLNRHVNKGYKCKQCGYKTNCNVNMRRHTRNHDHVKLYECNVCKKGYNRVASLKKHLKCVHLDEKRVHCAHCDYKTNCKLNLVTHINNKHGTAHNKKYNCSKCNYETNRNQAYKIHLKNHPMEIKNVHWLDQDRCTFK